ncbi:fumarate hydratase C-terminal domain-containing protein [Vibrio lentus]|nr:fumarate hydratase C-terminal domain-containing protein [Vibrio lentus]
MKISFMEAIYEFEVEDMPVAVAVDSNGVNAHQIGPDTWKVKIAEAEKHNLPKSKNRNRH